MKEDSIRDDNTERLLRVMSAKNNVEALSTKHNKFGRIWEQTVIWQTTYEGWFPHAFQKVSAWDATHMKIKVDYNFLWMI